jgi:hypothetical protein
MTSHRFFLAATTALAFACATAFLPLMAPREAAAQDNPTMTNVIPAGGHYSVQGKLQSLDQAAMTLTLVSDKGGTLPITIGPEAEDDVSNVSVGDVVNVHYTRSVTFVAGSPNVNVSNVPATATVGQVAQTPGGIGPNAATIVARIVKVDGTNSFDVVNANGGGIYTVKVTNPARQQALKMLKVGDSVTVSVGPLIATSVAKCGVFGMGLFGC